MGLIGGAGGFIGRVHAAAALRDHRCEIVAGALSTDAGRSAAAAKELGIPRSYATLEELLESREKDGPIDFVTIATPNHLHYPMARAALEAGLDVVCDKPMTIRPEHARDLAQRVEASDRIFALSHNYSGYPMIREARELVRSGDIGEIRAIRATYIQGWMCAIEPGDTPERGQWKTDPRKTGAAATLNDVGTHAFQLASYITGLTPRRVSSHLRSFHPDRELDDYGHALVEFEEGADAMITVSQITHGRLNDLEIQVDGTKASLTWRQEQPETLTVKRTGQPVQIYERSPSPDYLTGAAQSAARIPSGHPEGFIDAFANVYAAFFDDLARRAEGKSFGGRDTVYPNVFDGVEGVEFVTQAVASSEEDGAWKMFN